MAADLKIYVLVILKKSVIKVHIKVSSHNFLILHFIGLIVRLDTDITFFEEMLDYKVRNIAYNCHNRNTEEHS